MTNKHAREKEKKGEKASCKKEGQQMHLFDIERSYKGHKTTV